MTTMANLTWRRFVRSREPSAGGTGGVSTRSRSLTGACANCVSRGSFRFVDPSNASREGVRQPNVRSPPQIAKPAHFGSSLFTFGRIPQAILDGIERIDLSDSSETDFIATAAALPKLKNVSKLELFVDGRLPTSSQYERRDGVSAAGRQARQLAKEAFKAASSQFQCLMIHDAGYGAFDLNSISAFANADSLRRLSVRNFGRSLFTAVYGVPAAPLRKLATNYPALTYLDLTGTDSVDFGVLTRNVPWKEAEHFSSLQVFLVRATATSVFDFAQSTMPKLEALKVTFTNRYWAPDELSATWTLPSLKRVQIRGPSEFTTFLAQLQLPVLQKIEIAIVSAEGRAVDCSKLFTTDTLLPQNVVLHLTFDRRLRIEHADAVVQWCEKHQIRLFRFSCNIFAPYTGRMNRLDDDEALERQADAIEAALCWAAERKDRLLQFKDAAGLQELAELVKPLYEREYIEGM